MYFVLPVPTHGWLPGKNRKGGGNIQSGTGAPAPDREIFVGGAAGSEKTRVEIGLVRLARLSHPRPLGSWVCLFVCLSDKLSALEELCAGQLGPDGA